GRDGAGCGDASVGGRRSCLRSRKPPVEAVKGRRLPISDNIDCRAPSIRTRVVKATAEVFVCRPARYWWAGKSVHASRGAVTQRTRGFRHGVPSQRTTIDLADLIQSYAEAAVRPAPEAARP